MAIRNKWKHTDLERFGFGYLADQMRITRHKLKKQGIRTKILNAAKKKQ